MVVFEQLILFSGFHEILRVIDALKKNAHDLNRADYMTNLIVFSTLSIFHSFPATYELAQDASHITMILDTTTSAWLIDFLSQGYVALWLEISFEKFHGRYGDLIEKYQRLVKEMVSD